MRTSCRLVTPREDDEDHDAREGWWRSFLGFVVLLVFVVFAWRERARDCKRSSVTTGCAATVKMPSPLPRCAFAPASEDQAFRFQSGATARSLEEFAKCLAEEPVSVVWYHRAHFAPWVRDVVGDAPLSRRIEAYAQQAPAPDVFRELVTTLVLRRLDELRAARPVPASDRPSA